MTTRINSTAILPFPQPDTTAYTEARNARLSAFLRLTKCQQRPILRYMAETYAYVAHKSIRGSLKELDSNEAKFIFLHGMLSNDPLYLRRVDFLIEQAVK